MLMLVAVGVLFLIDTLLNEFMGSVPDIVVPYMVALLPRSLIAERTMLTIMPLRSVIN
jgi:hypothetical protein